MTAAAQSVEGGRFDGIGSSDVPQIVGVSTFGGPWDVWLSKQGAHVEHEPTERMEAGTWLEDAILDWAAHRWGYTYHARQHTYRVGWRRATPDAVGLDEDGVLCLFEAKNVSLDQMRFWGKDTEEAGDGTVPDYIRVQCQWQLDVARRALPGRDFRRVWTQPLFAGNTLRRYRVDLDEPLIAAIDAKVTEFYERHIVTGEPPPLDGTDGCRRALEDRHPRAEREEPLELDANAAGAAQRYFHALKQEGVWKAAKEQAGNELRAALGDHGRAVCEGLKVTWSEQSGRRSCDFDRLEKDYPEAFAAVVRQGAANRVLRVNEDRRKTNG